MEKRGPPMARKSGSGLSLRPSANGGDGASAIIKYCCILWFVRCHHGDSGFSLYESQNRDSIRRQQASHFRL